MNRRSVVIGLALIAIVAGGLNGAAQRGRTGTSGAKTGLIKGHVRLNGKLPGNPVIRMGMDPMCATLNAGHRPVQETVLAAADGSLGNVFVSLQGAFPASPVPAQPVTIDQRACLYVPRVIGARVGQTLQVRNSDNVLHNVHSFSARGNSFNVSQPKAGMVQQFKLTGEETMLRIGCDVHRWMITYVGILSHPYFATTGVAGNYEIGNVPAGAHTIQSWHEKYGVKSQKVIVRPGAVTTVDFTY